MKILLFGKNGQLGWELQRSLVPLGDLVALDADSKEFCGDFTNLEGIANTIRDIAPDVIVNAAAYTAVDKAESDQAVAHAINALAPALLAQEAKRLGACLVHYSTDYVFDGSGATPWKETDRVAPLSVYGKTKLEGDVAIQNAGGRYLIFRTSWIYAARGDNFAKTMLRLAQTRESLNVINDQVGAPTGADLLADLTAHCLLQLRLRPELSGVYHVAASGETTWYDYACFVIERARRDGVSVLVKEGAVKPIPTSDYPVPAARPRNSRLDTQKFRTAFQLYLPHWQQGMIRMLTEMAGTF